MEARDGHAEGKKLQEKSSVEMERKRIVTGACPYIALDTIALSFCALIELTF